MDGDEDTLPIYHGQGHRTTGALNYYPATATQQQSGADTSPYIHYAQQPPPPSQLAPPPPQASRSGGGRMYPLDTTNGGHNQLNRSISIPTSTRRPQDGTDGGYALDQTTQTSLSFYPAFHTQDSLSNQPTQQPDTGPAYYQGQPRRSHTQIDTRSAHHSPRRQPLGPVSPLPSPGLPPDSQAYRTTSDPYAPPSHPPSFQKPPATASSYGSPTASTTAYSPSISGHIYTPPAGPPAALAAAPDSLYPAHQPLPRAAIQQSQAPGPSTPHGYGPPVQQQQQYYLPPDQTMAVEPPSPAPKRKTCGFKRVRDANDLRPAYAPLPSGTGQPSVCTNPGLLLRTHADPTEFCAAPSSAHDNHLTDVQHL